MLYKYKLSLTPKFESAYPCPIIQPYYIHDQEDIYNVEANYLANSIYITNKSEGITNPGLFQEHTGFFAKTSTTEQYEKELSELHRGETESV